MHLTYSLSTCTHTLKKRDLETRSCVQLLNSAKDCFEKEKLRNLSLFPSPLFFPFAHVLVQRK